MVEGSRVGDNWRNYVGADTIGRMMKGTKDERDERDGLYIATRRNRITAVKPS